MFITRGDVISMRSRSLGVVREALVVDVLGMDGRPPYRVRWTDTGEEQELVPGPDADVHRQAPDHPPEHVEQRLAE